MLRRLMQRKLQVDLILLAAKFGYPPETNEEVYKEVLEQAEKFKKYHMPTVE